MSFDKQQLNQKTRQAKGQVFVTPANLLCSPERVCQVLCLCHVAKTCLCHSSDPRIPHFATHRTWLMRPTAPGQVSEYQSEPQLPDPEAPPARKLTAAAKTQIDQRLWRYPQIKGASAGKGVRGVLGGWRRKHRGRIWQFLCLEIDMASKARAHYAIIQGRGPRKGRQPQKTKTFCRYIFIMLK